MSPAAEALREAVLFFLLIIIGLPCALAALWGGLCAAVKYTNRRTNKNTNRKDGKSTMSSAYNHMARPHRSERYKPAHAGGRNFSRSKYHKVSSARPGLLSGLIGAITRALRKRSREKPKGGANNAAEEL